MRVMNGKEGRQDRKRTEGQKECDKWSMRKI